MKVVRTTAYDAWGWLGDEWEEHFGDDLDLIGDIVIRDAKSDDALQARLVEAERLLEEVRPLLAKSTVQRLAVDAFLRGRKR